ncbi:hypothetical protein MM440_06170 [Arsenicicoccus piscis]|uniref:Uncharacterized protein n=1 Tax=Arsenicicoccus piscis TaxID=673954 RepID=A0ABQ6HVI1_9MICO|nr:hypothetical protein [Arsenicicoccus piscis]MCH8627378.1 hypothetical protein [Arsenicicoccus piscis]GMA21533.1 hypothetical protein GCM10025862_35540 [Arsenicicoccus piscis]GMA22147.1 hypothetical protein GCM10025862_41700 [Arsenicicoccus piscis]
MLVSMEQMEYAALLDDLTHAKSYMHALRADRDDLVPVCSRAPGYVEPTLTISSWPQDASTLVIEASAATGKSALARALAADLKWPLVNGHTMQVGVYSIQGLITSAAGFDNAPMKAVVDGVSGLIIDALDEAQLRAGQDNFLSCLNDLKEIYRQSSGPQGVRVIALARRDCAEVICNFLEGEGVPFGRATLDFFSLDKAREFVEKVVEHDKKGRRYAKVPTPFTSPYKELLDHRLAEAAQSLIGEQADVSVDWAQLKGMLGYPPVLSALAPLVAVPNPSTAGRLTANGRAGVLLAICSSILDREARKVRDSLLAQLKAKVPAQLDLGSLEQIYSPQEQIFRLAERSLNTPMYEALPAGLPGAVREEYERKVQEFFDDHPFYQEGGFASLVFEDYIKASLAILDPDDLMLLGEVQQKTARPGPFFGRFLSIIPRSGESNESEEDGSDEDLPRSIIMNVMDSLLLERDWLSAYDDLLFADIGSNGSFLEVDSKTGDHLRVQFGSGDQPVALPSELRDCMLSIDGQAVIPATGHMRFGPRVMIAADSIDMRGATLEVRANARTAVILLSNQVAADTLKRVSGDPDGLKIISAAYSPILHRHVVRIEPGLTHIPFDSFMDLRAILRNFRSSVASGQACHADKMDLLIVRGRTGRQAILSALIERGAVVRDGQIYRLELSRLGSLGFGLNDLQHEPSQAVLAFLASVQQGGK